MCLRSLGQGNIPRGLEIQLQDRLVSNLTPVAQVYWLEAPILGILSRPSRFWGLI